MIKIVISSELCKGCHICVEFCPKKIIKKGNKISDKGIDIPIITEPENCVKCYNCVLYCPDFAIDVI